MKSTDLTAEFYDKLENFILSQQFNGQETRLLTASVRNARGLNAKVEQAVRFITDSYFIDESAKRPFIHTLKKLQKEYLDSLVMPETAKKRNMKRIVKTKGWRK